MKSSPHSTDPRWILGIGSLLLALLFGVLAFNDYKTREAVWSLQMAQQGELQALALRSAQQGLEDQARLIATTLGTDPQTLRLVRQADRAIKAGAQWHGPRLIRIRQQLTSALTPSWQAMQNYGALQLQLYWGESGIALLRMHDPEAFGDAVADDRPLLYQALTQGKVVSGLDIGRHSAGNRAIVPIRASSNDQSEIVGALEVGFGTLPDLKQLGGRLNAGLGLLVNRAELEEVLWSRPTGIQLDGLRGWLLDTHSAPQILDWARSQSLPSPEAGQALRMLESNGRSFLLNQVPLHDVRAQQNPDRLPMAVALVWRDITSAIREQQQAERRLLLKWGMAWATAQTLLLVLAFMLHRRGLIQRVHQLRSMQQERNRRRLLERGQKIATLLPGMVFQLKRSPSLTYSVLYASEGARQIYGASPEQLIENAAIALAAVYDPDRPELRAAIERSAAELGSGCTRYRIRNPEKGLIWVEVRATAERLRDGSVLWHGFIADITPLMTTTLALSESESRFRSMVSNLPGVVYRRSGDADRAIRYMSDGIERLTGYPASDFMAPGPRLYCSMLHPDDHDRWQSHSGDHFEHTYRLINAHGETLWVQENSRALRDENGCLQWYDGFIWDVTARARAEREANERESYVRLLIANVVDAIIIINQRGLIETFNHAAERTFGYSEEDVLGRNLSMLMPEPYRTVHDVHLQDYEQRGEGRSLEQNRELQAIRRNGEIFTIELRVSEISHSGERKFIGLVRDITERKRIEQMKSEFVSVVSHELRTPLTSISGALGLIIGGAAGEVPPAMGHMLGIAQQNSQRLGLLIGDLLDMEKLVAGQMSFELHCMPLLPLLEDALRSNQAYADRLGVRFELGERAAATVMVDELRLQQVLANLLSNAAKFSPSGEVVILSSHRHDDQVRVCVRDFGPGIPQTFRQRIFQKFSQADSSDTRQKGGTGLGLAISKELIEHMNGRIGFDSELGQGACFWFDLPAQDTD
ncbi:PAS domain-containing sensor histidine kinase [Stutzerimonas zhaodongensis]|uniref:PAS domain-containing sensor histidine kinase n=1 Tax=Stutzerimonas zhaodongensis TaxID=1176257 RepID=UPI002106202B|nr:PAS domain S-box protein [Stutzerimonas zhaodongensis]MCQ2030402.1 PAS domain S-box protein [Stutzerimonas zhaodongensis]